VAPEAADIRREAAGAEAMTEQQKKKQTVEEEAALRPLVLTVGIAASVLLAIGVGAVVARGGGAPSADRIVASALSPQRANASEFGSVATEPTAATMGPRLPLGPPAPSPTTTVPPPTTTPAHAEVTDCSARAGSVVAVGTLANQDADDHRYSVRVDFVDVAGAPVGSATAKVATVAPGRIVTWTATAPDPGARRRAGGGCRVGEVAVR
jgi:hypothetical protein